MTEAITYAIIMVLFVISNVLCLIIGANVGMKASKGESIELPTINPVEVYKKHEAKREAEMEQNKIETIMRNIEAYNGTSIGQKDVL